jgi:hypothetical protein
LSKQALSNDPNAAKNGDLAPSLKLVDSACKVNGKAPVTARLKAIWTAALSQLLVFRRRYPSAVAED